MPQAWVKIAIYVPLVPVTRASDGKHFPDPMAAVRAAISEMTPLGAAVMGAYDNVTFTLRGEGGFRPIEGKAAPSEGEAGKLYWAEGAIISFLAPRKNARKIVGHLTANHPYEQPHIEIISLIRHPWDGLGP